MTLELKEYISIGSMIVSVTALLMTLRNNNKNARTKKYELASAQHNKILSWFGETVEALISLRHKLEFGEEYKKSDLAHLSLLIEIGRYLFPNLKRKNDFAQNKPQIYKGKRKSILDILVFSYRILLRGENKKEDIEELVSMQKLFTSLMLEVLDPQRYVKELGEYTGMDLAINFTYEEFLDDNVQKNYKDSAIYKRVYMKYKDNEGVTTGETSSGNDTGVNKEGTEK